jgi:hypothetical protein
MICATCASPNRDLIEVALAAGQSYRAVAVAYGVSRGSLGRHQRNHRNPGLVVLAGGRRVAADGPMVEALVVKVAELETMQRAATDAGNLTQALQAIRQAAPKIEMIGRLRGEFVPPEPEPVDLKATPEYIELEAVMMDALEAYPAAYRAVADALS